MEYEVVFDCPVAFVFTWSGHFTSVDIYSV